MFTTMQALLDRLCRIRFKIKRLLWQLKLFRFCISNQIYYDDFSYPLKVYSFMLQCFIDAPEEDFMTVGRAKHAKKFKHLKELAWRLSNGDSMPQEGQCSGKYHSDWKFIDDGRKFVRMEFYNKVPRIDFEKGLFERFWNLNKKYFRNWWD